MKYDNGKENEIYVAIPFITLTLEKNDKKYWNARTAHFQIYGFTCSNFSIFKLLNIRISKYSNFQIFQFLKSYLLYIYITLSHGFLSLPFKKGFLSKIKTRPSRDRDASISYRLSESPGIPLFALLQCDAIHGKDRCHFASCNGYSLERFTVIAFEWLRSSVTDVHIWNCHGFVSTQPLDNGSPLTGSLTFGLGCPFRSSSSPRTSNRTLVNRLKSHTRYAQAITSSTFVSHASNRIH